MSILKEEASPREATATSIEAMPTTSDNVPSTKSSSNTIVAEENKIVNTSDETKYLLKSLSDDAVGVYGRVSEIEGQNGVDSGTVLRNFNRFYLGGLRGESFLKLSARYGDRISYQSKKLAYEQGIAEAKQNEKNRVTDSKKAKVYEGGLENREALLGVEGIDKKQLDLIDRVSRILGVKVRISDIVKNSKGKEVNAKVSDGVIEISKKAVMGEDSKGGALRFLFNHEITHRIGELAPKQYRKFCDIALDYASLKTGLSVNELIDRYSNERGSNGEDLNVFELMDEISADVAGMDIFSSDLIEYAARENIGVFEKMKNLLFDVLDKLGIAKYSEIDKLKRTWQKAFDKAKRQAEINSRNVDLQEDSGVERYSVDKRKKSLYNEYMTNAMIWAKSTDRQLGDLKILNANGKNFALIEATEDGFVEIKRGTYKEVQARYERAYRKAINEIYGNTKSLEADQGRDIWDMQHDGNRGNGYRDNKQVESQELQNNTSRNNEYLRTGDKGKHSSGKINPFESESLNYEGKNNVDNISKGDIIVNKKQMFGDDVKQLNNVVMQSQIKAKDKLGYLPPTGYAYTNNYFVAFKNKGAGDYKFEMAIWVDGNEDFIDYLQEAINNGRIKQSTRNFTSIVNDFRRGNGSDNRNNVIIEKGRTSSINDRLSGREQGSDTERYIGGNDKDSKGRYSSGEIDPFGKNGGQNVNSRKTQISYSNKNKKNSFYWYPDLPKRKLDILKQRIKSDIKRSKNTITDTANWMFTDIDDTDVFAIYSTENFDEPTLLYESKGKKAEKERSILLDLLEVVEYGKNTDGKSRIIGRVSGGNWMQNEYNMADSGYGLLGRNGNTGNATILQRQSSTHGSRAFENVIKNLFEIQEGGRYSSGEIDPFGKNGGQTTGVKKSRSYSNKNTFWYPDLPKRKLEILKQRIKSDIKRSKNTITDTANWMFTDIDDTDVFAIYSTENFDEPTLLYESKGKKAENERNELLKILEDCEYGRNDDGQSKAVNTILGSNWMQDEYDMANSGDGFRHIGRESNTGNATILQGQSSTYGSRAFKNVVKNLFEIQEGGRYSSGEIDPFGKNGGQNVNSRKTQISYSNKNKKNSFYWYPDLPKRKLDILKQRIKSDIKRSKNTITDMANWMFTDIDDTDVFAIYSTENFDEPTLLYESKGKKAENERKALLDILEGKENGKNTDRKSRNISRLLVRDWMQDEHSVADSDNRSGRIGRESNTGDDAVLQGQSSTYGSRAFKNVVKNLFEIQEGGRYSSGEIDPFGKNGGQNVNSRKTQISYSNKNKKNSFYWYPDLPKRKLDILKQRIKSDIKRSKNTITDMANWMFTDIDDTDVFAIYSTENFDEPTLLYESKGKQAVFEKEYLSNLLEVIENGKSANRKSRIIGRVSGSGWLRQSGGGVNGDGTMGRGRSDRDVGILQGQSKSKPSRAFKNVVKNLVEIQEGGRYSSGEIDPFGKEYLELAKKIKNNESDNQNEIKVNMSEDERYEILKDKKISIVSTPRYDDYDIDFDFLENNIKSVVEKSLLKKFQELGLFKIYTSIAVDDVYFDFTGKGFRKSLHSQENYYGGNKSDFAKVLLNLQKLLDSSMLIETHTDKGIGTDKEKRGLERVYVLLSALRDGEDITPVQFEIEQYISKENRLYLAVALTKIETSVKGNTAPDKQKATSLLPISNISISEIFAKINPLDKNFLKYVPNQFLNEEQIQAKNRALEIEKEKYSRHSSGEIDPFGKIAKDLEVLNKAYGTIEKGEKPMRDVNIPKQISDDRYTQRFARTVIESDKITDKQAESILEAVRDGVYTYSKISDEKAWNAAKKRYEEWGHKDCLEQWDIDLNICIIFFLTSLQFLCFVI